MITITYIDGTTDEFKTTKYVFTENDDDDWVIVKENSRDPDNDDEYDADEDVVIAEIRKDQVRKIQYD